LHEVSSTVKSDRERAIFTQAFHKSSKALYEEKYKDRESLDENFVHWKHMDQDIEKMP
jgi:hypothetical protein